MDMPREPCVQCKQSFFFRSAHVDGQLRICERCVNISQARDSEQREIAMMLSQCTRCGTTAFPFCKTPACPTCLKEMGLEDDGNGGFRIDRQAYGAPATPPATQRPRLSFGRQAQDLTATPGPRATTHPKPNPILAPAPGLPTVASILSAAAARAIDGNTSRLSQDVNFGHPPSQLNDNLQRARKQQTRLRQASRAAEAKATRVKPPSQLNIIVRCAIFTIAGKRRHAPAVKLPALRDIHSMFDYNVNTNDAFQSLMDKVILPYRLHYESEFGPFPQNLSELSFELQQGQQFAVAIAPEWRYGTIHDFVRSLQDNNLFRLVKNMLVLQLTFHQAPLVGSSAPSSPVNIVKKRTRYSSPDQSGGSSYDDDTHSSNEASGSDDHVAPDPKRLRNRCTVDEKTPQNVTHPPIRYTSVSVNEIIKAHISADGESYLKSDVLSEPSSILVADRWFADKEGSKIPAAGGTYLGSGYFKFGVRGIFDGKQVAVFQSIPKMKDVTEDDNYNNLTSELSALRLADHYMEKFVERAAETKTAIPNIRWNVSEAFVGRVEVPDQNSTPVPGTREGEAEHSEPEECEENHATTKSRSHGQPSQRILPYSYVLVVPLLTIDGSDYEPIRFPRITNHQDWRKRELDDAMTAFLHFAFVKSKRTLLFSDLQGVMQPRGGCILFDPQFSTRSGVAAPWDFGEAAFTRFLSSHECNKICDKLEMEAVIPPPPPTQRPKPRPAAAKE